MKYMYYDILLNTDKQSPRPNISWRKYMTVHYERYLGNYKIESFIILF